VPAFSKTNDRDASLHAKWRNRVTTGFEKLAGAK
jgi:hypothetical protein